MGVGLGVRAMAGRVGVCSTTAAVAAVATCGGVVSGRGWRGVGIREARRWASSWRGSGDAEGGLSGDALAERMAELNARQKYAEALALFDRSKATPSLVGEYTRSLVMSGRYDRAKAGAMLLEAAQQQGYSQQQHLLGRAGFGGGRGTVGGDGAVFAQGAIGSRENPVHMVAAQPAADFRGSLRRFAQQSFWLLVGYWLFLTLVNSDEGPASGSGGVTGGGGGGGLGAGGGLGRIMFGDKEVLPATVPTTRFADVRGCDEALDEISELVDILKNPEKFTKAGATLPRGLLLTGPPGTGKTLMAKSLAGEAGVPFFYEAGSSFDEMFVGVGPKRIRALFAAARASKPSIIFIDEIDACGARRGTGARGVDGQSVNRGTLQALLNEMDGFGTDEGVIVIGATNLPDALDPALMRPGRFDKQIAMPLPDIKGREEILGVHTKGMQLTGDVDLRLVARSTTGFSGADLHNLCNIAAISAARAGTEITPAIIDEARDRVTMGMKRSGKGLSAQNRKLTAYHEGGHALVALLTKGAMPVHKVTILPRGRSLGLTAFLANTDTTSISRKELVAQLDVAMGGRVAEEIIFGEDAVTSGASGDIQQATALARRMVMRDGLGKGGRLIALDPSGNDGVGVSPDELHQVEAEVREMIDAAHKRAFAKINKHKDDLHVLAKGLLEHETLTREEICKLLKMKDPGDGDAERTTMAKEKPGAALLANRKT